MAFSDFTQESGIITHSLLKTFRRCPRQTLYKHIDLLAPRSLAKPLKRGTWFHEILEAYYSNQDWKKVHESNTAKFSELFDEEKEKLGDLPTEIERLMRSYLWHYKNDEDWIVHELEKKIEVELPTGQTYRGKIDLLIENDTGLWIVDHKTHKQLPGITTRLLDQQSVLYIWACRRNGIPVRGFIWNYIRTDGPRKLRITRNGTIAKNQGPTDFPTAVASLREQEIDPKQFKAYLLGLKAHRYVSGQMQYSPFFQREVFEKNDEMIKRALKEAIHTAKRFQKYNFKNRDAVERAIDRSCDWCGYKNLCTTELIGGNADNVRRQEFMKHDPLAYYGEEPPG